jgi:hypothetical protein
MAPHPATLPEAELLKQCEIGKGRTSGPGGQHRNEVETKVLLKHLPTGVKAQAGERRSAEENRKVAVFRLRLALATKVRTAPMASDRFGDTRSDLWKARTTPDGRIVCNPGHHDYPALLAEALNVIGAVAGDPARAALRLSCTPSQMVKLVQEHPPAMAWWNTIRAAHGQHPLRQRK